MRKPRTVAIVQARMNSTRLPGKVIMHISGRPLLTYLVDRISKALALNAIVVATTTNEGDNVIIEECERLGIANFRGSELDVLSRYVSAATACDADLIVRVTADNPFTDPDSIDRVVKAVAQDGADYAIEANLPVGVTAEALNRKALMLMDSAANTAAWREHVTLYAKENPQALRCAFLPARAECNRPDLSFTVDTLDQYLYVRAIATELPSSHFQLKNLIAVADAADVRLRTLAI